jgi:hypothetical protein
LRCICLFCAAGYVPLATRSFGRALIATWCWGGPQAIDMPTQGQWSDPVSFDWALPLKNTSLQMVIYDLDILANQIFLLSTSNGYD